MARLAAQRRPGASGAERALCHPCRVGGGLGAVERPRWGFSVGARAGAYRVPGPDAFKEPRHVAPGLGRDEGRLGSG